MLKFKKMGTEKIPILLITANVGSIFESPTVMLPMWTTEFLQTISKMEPKFIGLHMQEVGGKTYEKSMQYVQEFIQRLCDSPELRLFDKIRIYLDEDYSSPEKFTALGNMYFVHSSLTEVKMWDFVTQGWVSAEGKEVYAGNIEKAPTKEKAKFPQHFFPECKWSRKGFLRVRWMIRNTAFECVNVHLFHDASNLLSLEACPSVYCRSRRRALRHTLQHLHHDPNQPPFFIFGDFNFRLDTGGVVKKLTEDLKTTRIYNGKSVEYTKLQFRNQTEDRVILTVGKKEFSHVEHQKVFREPWVLKFDKELEALKPHLYEFPIKFPPSYPFEENVEQPTHFMKTRCPSWCDRILLSQTARLIIHHLDGAKLMQRDPSESRRSIVEQMDGVLKHTQGSRRSIAESTDSGGGSPSKSSHRSSAQNSSSESSPARSASPSLYDKHYSATTLQPNSSPGRKPSPNSEFDGLTVPGIAQSRKSIADPTNIIHALNARSGGDCSDGSPTRRRLVRNQSEGSPKMGEHADLRKMSTDSNNPSLRKRVEYGIMGESTCMGDHKPVYLRLLLQSDKGTVRCCTQDCPQKYCYSGPPEAASETCFRHPSAHSLSKCPSKECFEPLTVSFRGRIASHISYDSGFRRSSSKDRPCSLIRLGTDPGLARFRTENVTDNKPANAENNKYSDSRNAINKFGSQSGNETQQNFTFTGRVSNESFLSSNEGIDDFESHAVPDVQITDADYISYDGLIVNNIDPHLLCCASAPQDPYTPESIESHSPFPELCSNRQTRWDQQSNDIVLDDDNLDSGVDSKVKYVLSDEDSPFFIKKCQSVGRSTKSVSPRQLKSRLENILRSSKNSVAPSECSSPTRGSEKSRDVEKLANSDIVVNNDLSQTQDSNGHRGRKTETKKEAKCICFGCRIC